MSSRILSTFTKARDPLRSCVSTSFTTSSRYNTPRSQLRFTPPAPRYLPLRRPFYHCGNSSENVKRSGSSFYTVVVVCGIAIGAVLYPLIARNPPSAETSKWETSATFDSSDLTDSYLIMAPNVPAGRPGTLTADQEAKLRELWAATMKVFGVYEPPLSVEVNGTEQALTPATVDATEKEGKKEKKKSRLSVFKRKDKGDKATESTDSLPSSGTATPADISTLSIADDDDKHGQTKDFKAAIANTDPEDLRKAFWSMVKHDHPDGLLLRFLRARKWDVEKALIMMISTMHWRAEEQHVDDDIVQKGELHALEQSKSDDPKTKKEGEDFLAQLRMGKSFLHGLDKEGRPMCIVRARLHRQGEQSEESIERFTVYTIETARVLLRPPVDTATIVFDMTGFSMANMDYAPVKFMIKCFEANYPESLGTVLVYKAPWVFNAIWSIIRGWLDPVVAGKVHFCKQESDLEEFVPKSQIIAELDGDEKWEYKYTEPVEGENDLMKDEATREKIQTERDGIVKKYESTILSWIHAPEAESMEDRRKGRNTVAEELKTNYWKLDPYIRARTLYDRIGIIHDGGQLTFYGAKAPATPQATAGAPETSEADLD